MVGRCATAILLVEPLLEKGIVAVSLNDRGEARHRLKCLDSSLHCCLEFGYGLCWLAGLDQRGRCPPRDCQSRPTNL